jgi:N-acetylneuraminate synthase
MAIKIADKKIGDNEPCFIIAEIGINHNNKIEIAKKMIDAAADAGCDAVKFQAFKAERMYPKSAGKIDWKDKDKEYSYDIFEANKSFEVPDNWWDELQKYSHKRRVVFFASVCDEMTASKVIKYLDLVKTTSFAITHLPLLKNLAKYNKPLIFSTGTAIIGEIEEAYNEVKDLNKDIIILYCVSEYPTPLENTNIATIDILKEKFPKAVIGFSDHSEEMYEAGVAAIAHGAKVIEKHITLDRSMEGPDHFFALEPEMLKKMVAEIRKTEELVRKNKHIEIDQKLIGSKDRKLSEKEEYMRSFARRSVMMKRAMHEGERLTKDDIIVLRNGKKKPGLVPKWYDIISEGKYALTKQVEKEYVLQKEDIRFVE